MADEAAGIRFGQYVLLRRIARGGMAEVFLAQQRGLEGFDRRVAVKRILPHLADMPAFVQMFLGEARLAAQLAHPNIVHIYDFGKVDADYFLAMEYVEGVHAGTLFSRCQAEEATIPSGLAGKPGTAQRMSPAMIARLGADAAAALHHAHELRTPRGERIGLVHRDVSPANLMISFDGVVKLCDFGIAKAAAIGDQLTRPGTVKGKYAYMSPEQTTGVPLDGRSDVYSLAIVLWELVAGQTLVPRGDAVEAMRAIRDGRIASLARVAPWAPAPLVDAITRALATDRDARPTAMELAHTLETFVKSSPELVTPLQVGAWLRARFPRDSEVDDPPQAASTPAAPSTSATGDGNARAAQAPAPRARWTVEITGQTDETTARPEPRAPTGHPPGGGPPAASPFPSLSPSPYAASPSPSPNAVPPSPYAASPSPSPSPSPNAASPSPSPSPNAVPPSPSPNAASPSPSPYAAPPPPSAASPSPNAASPSPNAASPSPNAAPALAAHRLPSATGHLAPTGAAGPNAPTQIAPHADPRSPTASPQATTLLAAPVPARSAYGLPPPGAGTLWMQPRGPRVGLGIAVLVAIAIASFLIALAVQRPSRSMTATTAPLDAASPAVAGDPDAALAGEPDLVPVDAGSPEPPDAAPPTITTLATTTVEIRTRPDGATVKVAGRAHRSPATIELPIGRYFIDAELDGWMPERRAVDLVAGERMVQDIVFSTRLARAGRDASTGRLSVRTTPASEVFLGTRRLADTPFDLALDPGTYTLQLKHPRHPTVIRRVTITPGKTTRLTLTLP